VAEKNSLRLLDSYFLDTSYASSCSVVLHQSAPLSVLFLLTCLPEQVLELTALGCLVRVDGDRRVVDGPARGQQRRLSYSRRGFG